MPGSAAVAWRIAAIEVAFFAIGCGGHENVSPQAQGGNTLAGGTASGGATTGGTASGGASGGTPASGGAAGSVSGGASGGGANATGGVSGGGGAPGGGAAGAGGGAASGPCRPPADIMQPAAMLSQTGCMDASDIKKFASFVVPYEVNSPLWSDSADKTRGMVLPPGQKIHVKDCAAQPSQCAFGPTDTGKWVFPVGAVLLKNFSFDGKLVETRLFVHFDAKTWAGYGYQWNEAQTDATIVSEDGLQANFNTGTRTVDWSYPSRLECMTCHTKFAGDTLGPETKQLNRVVGGTNQLDTFVAMGLLDAPLAQPYEAALVTPYAGPAGAPAAGATLEQRARSYLHANCANCHRPDADFFYQDLRYGIPLKDMSICGLDPQKGNAGVLDAKILDPGQPMQSLLWLRMKSLENRTRMPQIATYHVDENGLALIGDWISSITTCPE